MCLVRVGYLRRLTEAKLKLRALNGTDKATELYVVSVYTNSNGLVRYAFCVSISVPVKERFFDTFVALLRSFGLSENVTMSQ